MLLLTLKNASFQPFSVEKLLVSYLVSAYPGRIPGCDGMATQQILKDYPQLAEKGVVPDCSQLFRWHPELQSLLKRFFRIPPNQMSF
jgi:hypothetical protein